MNEVLVKIWIKLYFRLKLLYLFCFLDPLFVAIHVLRRHLRTALVMDYIFGKEVTQKTSTDQSSDQNPD